MRVIGLIAAAAAGTAYLLCTEQGRGMTRKAGRALAEGRDRVGGYVNRWTGIEKAVRDALEAPHEDTAMAHAFQEAVA